MSHTPTTHEIRSDAVIGRAPFIHRREIGITIMQAERIAIADFNNWLTEHTRQAKSEAWHEGFEAGWEEHENPGPFVNDIWDAKTPNPYRSQP